MFWDEKMETLRGKDLEALQLKRLKWTLAQAMKVPFYRGLFREAGIRPADVKAVDDVEKLPFTRKKDLREGYPFGFLAVPRGQMEAALSLGMSTWTALRRVIIPQAVRIVIPPVTNDFIALFKDTSVCSVITVMELTGMYNRLYNNNPQKVLELGVVTSILYLLMSYPLSLFARRLEGKFKRVVA